MSSTPIVSDDEQTAAAVASVESKGLLRHVSFSPRSTTAFAQQQPGTVVEKPVTTPETETVNVSSAMSEFLQGQLNTTALSFNETNGSLQQIQNEIQERHQRMADLRAQLLGKQGELQALRTVQAKLTELAKSS